jgi:predicted Rossmann-fold nucleotide-binding protein
VAAEVAVKRPTLAVFASDRGPGDPERASIMSLAGSLFARRGARIVSLAEGNTLAVPLITSARAAGGEVLIIADDTIQLPPGLDGVPVERLPEAEARLDRMANLADVFVGLPGSLASASELYKSWVRAGGGASGKPVVLLNRNRAFEVMRGLAADVLSHSVKRQDRMMVFTDNVEDLWNRVAWALSEAGHAVS